MPCVECQRDLTAPALSKRANHPELRLVEANTRWRIYQTQARQYTPLMCLDCWLAHEVCMCCNRPMIHDLEATDTHEAWFKAGRCRKCQLRFFY